MLPPWPSAAPASGRVVLRRFDDDDVAIADSESGRALGMIGLWLRDRGYGRAQIGYAVAMAERAGFSYEGVLRNYLEIGGRRRDLASYALVRHRLPTSRASEVTASKD